MSLYQRSIEVILENQAPSGAYLASPTFPAYRYSWFRDGSFIAYAMDLVGETDSSRRFHDWAASVINDREATVRRVLDRAQQGVPLTGVDCLHTRYTVDGGEAEEGWPNHQLDGFGTWLWALERHLRLVGTRAPDSWMRGARLAAEYIARLWDTPCYDCWEEFPEEIHTHTLAAVRAGLVAHEAMTGKTRSGVVIALDEFIAGPAQRDGYFVKHPGTDVVDASLLGLAVPYAAVDPHNAAMRATVDRIEATLRNGGGVHRYPTDTYYGGGEWVLLTCWLAWYYLEVGDHEGARAALAWVQAQATDVGELPEQVPQNLIDPDRYESWRIRWGEIASPLLWSHAMYLICEAKLAE